MSVALGFFGSIVPWLSPCALELLTVTLVGGCGWPISSNLIHIGMASWEL